MAAFPVALQMKHFNELPQIYRDKFPLRTSLPRSLSNIRSGGTIDGLYVVLLDQYGEVVTSSDGHVLTLRMESLQQSTFTPKAESLTEIKENYGVYNLSEVTFSAQPGTKTRLTLSSSAINPALSAQASPSYLIDL